MSNVKVTYEEMRAAGQRLVNGEEEIGGQLDGLRREIASLVANGYVTDSSSKAFDHSYEEFTSGIKDVLKGLHGMADYLNKAAQTFSDADQALAGALR